MKSPDCSIVIRAYNEETHIGRLLQGILEQTVSHPEIILVDSGSTDHTREIAEKFPVEVVTIAPQDFTFGRSLNLGIARTTAPFVVMAVHMFIQFILTGWKSYWNPLRMNAPPSLTGNNVAPPPPISPNTKSFINGTRRFPSAGNLFLSAIMRMLPSAGKYGCNTRMMKLCLVSKTLNGENGHRSRAMIFPIAQKLKSSTSIMKAWLEFTTDTNVKGWLLNEFTLTSHSLYSISSIYSVKTF